MDRMDRRGERNSGLSHQGAFCLLGPFSSEGLELMRN